MTAGIAELTEEQRLIGLIAGLGALAADLRSGRSLAAATDAAAATCGDEGTGHDLVRAVRVPEAPPSEGPLRGPLARLAGAVLLRAVTPFELETLPDLSGTPVYLAAGRSDQMIPPESTERLAELLREAGAEVTLDWQPGGHGIGRAEVEAARDWLALIILR